MIKKLINKIKLKKIIYIFYKLTEKFNTSMLNILFKLKNIYISY